MHEWNSHTMKRFIIATVSAACLLRRVESHGFLVQPMGRSFVSYKFDPPEKRNYNPQGANAGGKAHVYNHGQLRWPNGRFGVCGDPWDLSTKPLEQAGRITATYSPGSTLTMHLLITANHWGRMEFNLCPRNVTSKQYNQRCTILQRADGRGPHWTLPPGELPDPQGRPLVPAYSDSSFSFYIYPEDDDFRDTPVYVLKYKLPTGFDCQQGCVLHWYWLTGNSCNPPCEASDPLYPNCNRLSMGYCGEPKAPAPEEFWGCSDIFVGDAGAVKKPHINSSWDALSERLRSAHEPQDKVSKPKVPVLPLSAYWRAELLAANELLDQTYNHGPQQAGAHQPVSSAEGTSERLLYDEPAAATEGQAVGDSSSAAADAVDGAAVLAAAANSAEQLVPQP